MVSEGNHLTDSDLYYTSTPNAGSIYAIYWAQTELLEPVLCNRIISRQNILGDFFFLQNITICLQTQIIHVSTFSWMTLLFCIKQRNTMLAIDISHLGWELVSAKSLIQHIEKKKHFIQQNTSQKQEPYEALGIW